MFSRCSSCFHKIAADVIYQWSDSEPEVDTVGIYVASLYNMNREFVIWIQFDNMKLGEQGHCEPRSLLVSQRARGARNENEIVI